MLKFTTSIVLLLASVQALSLSNEVQQNGGPYGLAADEKYTRFADQMSEEGYDWEAKQVTTEDGYILTTFHILGKTG